MGSGDIHGRKAIRTGKGDAVAASGAQGEQAFALGGAEQPYRIFLETMSEGAATLFANGTIAYGNGRFAEMVKMPLGQVIGRPIEEFAAPDRRDSVRALVARGLAGRCMEEVPLLAADGTVLWVQFSLSPLMLDSATGVCLVARDMTESRRAEELHAYLSAIVDSSEDAIIGKDLEGTVKSWNHGAEKLYGYSTAEMVGRPISLLLPPERAGEMSDILARMKAGQAIAHYETERVCKDGQRIQVSLSAAPIMDREGRVRGASTISRDITERQRAEAIVRHAAAYNRSLIEASLDPLVTIGVDGKIMDVNHATEKVTGHPREELIGTDFSVYFTNPEKARSGYQQAFREGHVQDYPLEIQDGKITPVLYNASVYRDETGKVAGVFAAARDITERKLAEKEARHAGAYNRSLIEASLDPLVTIASGGKIMDVNRATEKATGHSREELIGTDFCDYFTDPEKARAIYEKVFREGQVQDYALEITDGKTMPVLYNASVFLDENGRVAGVFAAARDITERKKAEQAQQESEQNFQALADLVPQLVWTCNRDGLSMYFNRRWVEYTGLTLEESYGKGWTKPFHDDDKQLAWRAWSSAVETGDPYRIQCRLQASDGSYRWFLTKGMPMRDATGGIVKWFGTCTDIDDLKRAVDENSCLNRELEERVQRRTAELEHANAELDSFCYTVSHDLRAPLRGISGFSAILLDEYAPQLPPEAQRLFGRVRENAELMGKLITDLLAFSRISRQPPAVQAVEPAGIVRQALDGLAAEQQSRRVEISVGKLPLCQADPALLQQVFVNLLSNALKFTRTREIARIEIGAAKMTDLPPESAAPGVDLDAVVYFVRDNGAGFDMRYADKLFGVFQRLHSTGDYEGTGVGLATVQRIIHRHSGAIWATAAVDRGATFYFTLGPHPEAAPPPQLPRERPAVVTATPAPEPKLSKEPQ